MLILSPSIYLSDFEDLIKILVVIQRKYLQAKTPISKSIVLLMQTSVVLTISELMLDDYVMLLHKKCKK